MMILNWNICVQFSSALFPGTVLASDKPVSWAQRARNKGLGASGPRGPEPQIQSIKPVSWR
jgi:hypothetical protein